MRSLNYSLALLAGIGLVACTGTAPTRQGTLAALHDVPADIEDVYLEDSLERAAQSYRRYLQETSESARTPEAMRRLADLQIEQAYGVMGSGEIVEMAAPESGTVDIPVGAPRPDAGPRKPDESDQEFEARVTARTEFLAPSEDYDIQLPGGDGEAAPTGPLEAIKTYQEILDRYPNYERNDKVLYQMSRAYDEIGQPDDAMTVMNRLVREYPYSKYVDEVHFRRGEYYFVRRSYLEAEEAYGAILRIGDTSPYYELGLYKLGWTFYKQELYEEALDQYIAVLDHRLTTGFDFGADYNEDDELRLADTFRVISLSFSNLGGSEVIDEYFSANGHRSYADKIYGNLGEFYFTKLRYEDAASVYRSFIELNAYHRVAPHYSMRIVEIYDEANFPQLVVKAKKEFSRAYAMDSEYWNYFDAAESPEVVGFLKTNLNDLASYYHALYQHEDLVDERPTNFVEAQQWYRQFLASFPSDPETPPINYRLADLLLENENFSGAAIEYERTAYDYEPHEQAAAAGYAAVYAHRQDLERATGARSLEVKKATVASSLRFTDAFPGHEQAPKVLGAAVDDLYAMSEFGPAIESATQLIERYPGADRELRRGAWLVIAHSSIDIAEYSAAEQGYTNVLALTDPDDESRDSVIDGLAAAIYKQGEQANLLEDYRAAADHFLRIKTLAPTSTIRTAAEYDAAAALIRLEDWNAASGVLEEFRTTHPEHELMPEATKQLAYVYKENGQTKRSAAEHERISAEATDPELAREALFTAAELYDEAGARSEAVRVFERYVAEYPQPLDLAMLARERLSEIYREDMDYTRYYAKLEEIVSADREAGEERTDRSRLLAADAALVLARRTFDHFAGLDLVQPFEESLAEKQRRMDISLAQFEELVGYEVAEVTAAATYYIAEIYMDFSRSLMESERPAGLSAAEKVDYEMVIEEEAFPFEERAIEIHEQNFELLAGGIYNPWVKKSLDQLAVLMPGRYAKNEISGGFLSSIDRYAYRMPIAPEPAIDGTAPADQAAETATQMSALSPAEAN